jgi:hypothetical protein
MIAVVFRGFRIPGQEVDELGVEVGELLKEEGVPEETGIERHWREESEREKR